MIFKLNGTMVFEAENIDDAFKRLAYHFLDLSEDGEGIEMLGGTGINIDPVEVK